MRWKIVDAKPGEKVLHPCYDFWTPSGGGGGGGGTLRFELDRGVLLKPQNPYQSLRVILQKKGTHF